MCVILAPMHGCRIGGRFSIYTMRTLPFYGHREPSQATDNHNNANHTFSTIRGSHGDSKNKNGRSCCVSVPQSDRCLVLRPMSHAMAPIIADSGLPPPKHNPKALSSNPDNLISSICASDPLFACMFTIVIEKQVPSNELHKTTTKHRVAGTRVL